MQHYLSIDLKLYQYITHGKFDSSSLKQQLISMYIDENGEPVSFRYEFDLTDHNYHDVIDNWLKSPQS